MADPVSLAPRYVARVAALGPFADIPVAQRQAWMGLFPPNTARRMTVLGLLLGQVLRDFPLTPEQPIFYATTFSEARSLELYLDGLPAASPLHFQNSIHPSGIEQVLIARGAPVAELWPLAGQAHLPAQLLLAALLHPAESAIVCGGEELGSWLGGIGAAAPEGFAFAALLSRDPTGALAEVRYSPEAAAGAEPSTLPGWHRALAGRQAWSAPADTGGGGVSLHWFS